MGWVRYAASSLVQGLFALALSICIVFVGEVAVSRTLSAALERSAYRATNGALHPPMPVTSERTLYPGR